MKTKTNPEPDLGRLFYAINPYEDSWRRHIALQVIFGGCDKTGNFTMRGQAPLVRATMTSPPPSLVGRKDRLRTMRKAVNEFGQNRFVYASFHRDYVEEQLEIWRDEGKAAATPKRAKLSVT